MEIAIIGGGITGLSTALALHKVGLNSTVYEQAESLNEIGAGIWLQPNAIQVLKWLDLYEEVESQGCVLNKMEITDSDLKPIKKIKQAVVSDRHGNQTIAIHRGKLQHILFDRFSAIGKIELGRHYLQHHADKNDISIEFENGVSQANLLLGADGIHSNVRNTIGLPSDLRYTNQICCRGIAKIKLPNHLKNEGKEIWGHKRRFGFSSLSDETVYFFAVINKEICPQPINVQTLTNIFTDFDPIVRDIINASAHMHTAELMDLKRLKTWSNSHTCLLGDAAHATTPNMGQGACQGIEDAYYISNALKKSTDSNSFLQFEMLRRSKVDYVVNNSWNFGRMVHSISGQFILKTIMKMTPEKVMSNQMNKLYTVEGL